LSLRDNKEDNEGWEKNLNPRSLMYKVSTLSEVKNRENPQ
jgi:hypothetical protein